MLPIYVAAVWFDAFDRFLALTNEPDSDAIDWLIILFVFLGIAAKIYSVRRTIDLHHEVRHRRKAEADAYELARQDVLTGLPNRRWFTEEFDKWSSEHNGGEVRALFVVDLDNFKPINDVYGHRLGDEVLRVVANGSRASPKAARSHASAATSSASSCITRATATGPSVSPARSCTMCRSRSILPRWRFRSA